MSSEIPIIKDLKLENNKGQIWNSDLWGCAWKALRQPSLTIETIWPDNGPYKSSLSMASSTVKSRHTKQQPDNHRIYIRTDLRYSIVDVLWGQPIKLIQVASNSELLENQWNDFLFFEIVPSHCFRASEASKINCLKN